MAEVKYGRSNQSFPLMPVSPQPINKTFPKPYNAVPVILRRNTVPKAKGR